MQHSAITEKEIMMILDSHFIIRLYNTFKDKENLYFLLEACVVGDLFLVLNRSLLYGKPECARYYAAVVVESFAYLHGLHIVYRDLKPENVLMKDTGEVKLCDMGIAKVVYGKTYTLCGTPEYIAPEILQQKGHGLAADWWCFGIFCYELLAAETPFAANSTMQIYKAINKGIDKIRWNQTVLDNGAKDMISALCHKTPSRRTPMLNDGMKKLKDSKLFTGVAWEKLNTKEGEVPFKPKVNMDKVCKGRVHQSDIESIQTKYVDDGSGWDKDF